MVFAFLLCLKVLEVVQVLVSLVEMVATVQACPKRALEGIGQTDILLLE